MTEGSVSVDKKNLGVGSKFPTFFPRKFAIFFSRRQCYSAPSNNMAASGKFAVKRRKLSYVRHREGGVLVSIKLAGLSVFLGPWLL